MPTLNRNNSNWSFEERRKINENWDILEGLANSTASGNNGLKSEVDELKNRVTNNTNRVTDAVTIASRADVKSDNADQKSILALNRSQTALNVTNDIDQKATEALSVAQNIDAKVDRGNVTAQNALNTSNLATIRVEEALTIANQAEQKSTYVQSQLDNIITNGDSEAEVVQARGQFETLRTRLDTENMEIEEKVKVLSKLEDSNKSAALGVELLSSNNWTLGANWVRESDNSFTHSTGSTETLSNAVTVNAGSFYEVVFTIDSTDADHGFKINVSLGDSSNFEIYEGAGNSITYRRGIKTINTQGLEFRPLSTFTGTIKNVSVKEIVGRIEPNSTISDSENNVSFELRPTDPSLLNLFIGKNSGILNTSGRRNAIIGDDAGSSNTSGYFNSVLGSGAFVNNTVGSRNVAIGYTSLRDNISGHRNIALGTFALNRNTHGHNNIGIGADTLWYNTTGSHNIALGLTAQEFNLTGTGNIALGYRAMHDNLSNNFNVAVGYNAALKVKSDNNVLIGAFSSSAITTGSDNTALGAYSLRTNITGRRNVAIGAFAGSSSLGADNTFLGSSAGSDVGSGADNVFLGRNAGSTVTTSNRSIFIGSNATSSNATTSDFLNIGNTLYGELGNSIIGIGIERPTARLHLGAGSAARPALKFTASSSLTANANGGGVEYNGTDLFFTTDTEGVRRKFLLDRPSVGLGVDNPTARLHLGPGSAARPIIKLTASDLTTSVNGGGIEYDGSFMYFTSDTEGVRRKILTNGPTVGIGVDNPTAILHLNGGTATRPSLRINAGVLTTVPQLGAIEYDGTSLYFTLSNGSRKKIVLEDL